MFKKIVVVEKSKIIREGLTTILYTHEFCSKVVCMEDFGEWNVLMRNTVPDLIILGLETMSEGKEKIKYKYKLADDTLFVGIVYQYYNHREVIDLFDEVIFITDSEDTIISKLKKLSSNTNNGRASSSSSEKLTDREKDVLKLLLRGLANKEVADQLSISPHTVVSHRKNIIEKTGIKSLSGLAVYAILNNIADLEDLKQ
ncbi:MAG: response regulator transcription factor [Dysgonamonadaceae bacterium]|jgi:DNA-binding NarL/FixJ family response regulator|nr:response regulator transcription factor [Dysgonamonadaceae bacterium]